MELQTVDGSSNVKAIGFDGSEIHVQFKTGSTYVYTDPTDEAAEERFDMGALFEDFAHADSKGKFFTQHIKPFLKFARID